MARLDPHSYADAAQPQTRSLEWRARVDFPAHTIAAEATLRLDRPGHGPLDLDTRDLTIDAVTDAAGNPLAYELAEADPILGARLRITLAGTDAVRIRYRTSKTSTALQWLEPEQTAGKREPFLFSQCQAIHARSVVPLQDTPGVRITYTAELAVPSGLRGLMAAQYEGRDELGPEAIERWRMPHPIPPYLFALAAGRLESREVGPISRVWAEPEQVDAAAWEFADVARMVDAGEALFGPYDWGRFDILVMPPSFPYGGMENPCLTFLTPTLLAKDRSLVNVLAHELAHSWTGNLVTNANAEHFWLNEGFTVYAERRIIEALEGLETRELHAALGLGALEEAIAQFNDRPALTKLRTDLAGVDPDDAFSSIPYEKGYLLLRAIEEDVGRERFDAFLKAYLRDYAFRAITTDDFVKTSERMLPGALARVHASRYFDEPGVPSTAPVARSSKLETIRAIGTRAVDAAETKDWSATEWQLYLDGIQRPAPHPVLDEIEHRFNLSASGNAEVLASWLGLAVSSGYAPSYASAALFVERVGRMKYLRPLYKALLSQPDALLVARAAFERAKGGYHPIARQVVEGLFSKAAAA